MKKLALALICVLVLCGCSSDDPLTEGFYTTNINNSEEIWTDTLWVDGTTTFNDQISLMGDGEVWLELRLGLDWSTVQALGKPTHVTRGIFDGYSLPVYAADNEELFFENCVPDRWKGPAWTYLQDVGDEPGQPGTYGGSLYIPSEATDEIYEFRNDTFSLSGTVGDRPVMVLEYEDDLYATCFGDDEVWVYHNGVWALSSAVGNGPAGMVVDDGFLYVACYFGDEIWRYSSATGWMVDPALGLGGVAGAVGTSPEWMASFGGDVYVGCGGVDDDVWIRTGGAWAKDDDVGNQPQVFEEHDGTLWVACEGVDEIWYQVAPGNWVVATNIQTNTGGSPIGLIEYQDSLYAACFDSTWSDHHTIDIAAVPFWNVNSDFTRVTADQPMFFEEYEDKLYCIAKVGDGVWVYEGETAKLAVHVWINTAQANATDAFRLEIEHESYSCHDIVPTTAEETHREILTGVAAQYTTYCLHIPIDMTGVEGDDSMAVRIARIASSDEIAGEVVIQHVGIIYKCDKLGNSTP